MRPGKKQIRVIGQRPDECSTCEGMGQTPATCSETRTRGPNGKLYTHRQGSGCPDCLGTGKKLQNFDRVGDSFYFHGLTAPSSYELKPTINHPHNNTTHTR